MKLKRKDEEHEEQARVIEWAMLSEGKHPELAWLFAIPNGGGRGKPFISKSGKKYPPLLAVRLKAEGLKRGCPDLCLPIARRGCHALFIEMKASDGTVNPTQRIWHEGLASVGNCVRVCYSSDEAIKVLQWYLS